MNAISDSDKQQRKDQFLEITHSEDHAQAERMLEWHDWAVDRAVNAFILGDTTPPASYTNRGRISRSTYEERDETVSDEPLLGNRYSRTPVQSSSGVISTLLGFPFWLVGKTLNFALRPITYALGAEDPPKDGESAALRFIQSFQSKYKTDFVPDFFPNSYRQAVTVAAQERKFLLVYLHSPLHEDTPNFCQTLSSEIFVNFLEENNVLIWGGSIWHADAYSISISLSATAFPFLALLMCSANQVQVMDRFEGDLSSEVIIDRLNSAMGRYRIQQDNTRRVQQERVKTRQILEEQDAEFKAALEADRLLQEKREMEMMDSLRREEEAKRQAESALSKVAQEAAFREQRILHLRTSIPEEPVAGPNTTRIRLQLPTGNKLDRRFRKEESLRAIHEFLELHFLTSDINISRFNFNTNFPKRTFSEADLNLSIVEAGLHPQALLLVLDLDA